MERWRAWIRHKVFEERPSYALGQAIKLCPHQYDLLEELRTQVFVPPYMFKLKDRKEDLARIYAISFARLYYGVVVGPDVPPPISRGETLTVKSPSGLVFTFSYEDLVKVGVRTQKDYEIYREGALVLFDHLLRIFKEYEDVRNEFGIEWLSYMFRSQPTCWWSDIKDLSKAPYMTVDDWIKQAPHKEWLVYNQIVYAAKTRGIQVPET